jgi:hypothetical protein
MEIQGFTAIEMLGGARSAGQAHASWLAWQLASLQGLLAWPLSSAAKPQAASQTLIVGPAAVAHTAAPGSLSVGPLPASTSATPKECKQTMRMKSHNTQETTGKNGDYIGK